MGRWVSVSWMCRDVHPEIKTIELLLKRAVQICDSFLDHYNVKKESS